MAVGLQRPELPRRRPYRLGARRGARARLPSRICRSRGRPISGHTAVAFTHTAVAFTNRLKEDPWGVLNESLAFIKEMTDATPRLTIRQRQQCSDMRLRVECALDEILPYVTGGWTRLESYIRDGDLRTLCLGAHAKGMDMRSYIVAAALAAAREDASAPHDEAASVIANARADLAGVV